MGFFSKDYKWEPWKYFSGRVSPWTPSMEPVFFVKRLECPAPAAQAGGELFSSANSIREQLPFPFIFRSYSTASPGF